MKIRITDKACGLEVGKEYDLCEQAAKTLVTKRQAVIFAETVIKKAVAKEPAPIKEDKPKETAKRKNK